MEGCPFAVLTATTVQNTVEVESGRIVSECVCDMLWKATQLLMCRTRRYGSYCALKDVLRSCEFEAQLNSSTFADASVLVPKQSCLLSSVTFAANSGSG